MKRRYALAIRTGEYRGNHGFHVFGKHPDALFGIQIFVRTRACAEYIRDLFERVRDRDERSRLVDAAIGAEGKPGTVFPPSGAGDVVGEVRS